MEHWAFEHICVSKSTKYFLTSFLDLLLHCFWCYLTEHFSETMYKASIPTYICLHPRTYEQITKWENAKNKNHLKDIFCIPFGLTWHTRTIYNANEIAFTLHSIITTVRWMDGRILWCKFISFPFGVCTHVHMSVAFLILWRGSKFQTLNHHNNFFTKEQSNIFCTKFVHAQDVKIYSSNEWMWIVATHTHTEHNLKFKTIQMSSITEENQQKNDNNNKLNWIMIAHYNQIDLYYRVRFHTLSKLRNGKGLQTIRSTLKFV